MTSHKANNSKTNSRQDGEEIAVQSKIEIATSSARRVVAREISALSHAVVDLALNIFILHSDSVHRLHSLWHDLPGGLLAMSGGKKGGLRTTRRTVQSYERTEKGSLSNPNAISTKQAADKSRLYTQEVKALKDGMSSNLTSL